MATDLIFVGIFFIGIMTQLFYKPDKARAWILKRVEGTFLQPQNKLQSMSLEMLLIIPTYLNWLVKFGIVGFIVFKGYDVLGFEKTLLILLILIYVSLTASKNTTI